MAVKMRLARAGGKKKPFYRVVVADSRMPRDGRHIEVVGRYNPRMEPSFVDIDGEKARKWLSRGAQPSGAVEKLLKIAGVEREAPSAPAQVGKPAKTETKAPPKKPKAKEAAAPAEKAATGAAKAGPKSSATKSTAKTGAKSPAKTGTKRTTKKSETKAEESAE